MLSAAPKIASRVPAVATAGWKVRAGLVSLLFLLSAASLTAQWLHHNLDAKRMALHSLLIMPGDVSVTRFGIKGGSPMPEASQELGKLVRAAAAQALLSDGCSVKAVSVPAPTAQSASDQPEQQDAVRELQQAFDVLFPKLNRHPGDVWNGRYTLGDEVLKINSSGDADGLVFVRSQGVVKTRGETGFQLMIGNLGSAWDHLEMQIAVADARNGTIVFYGRYYGDGDILKDGYVSLHAARESLLHFECTPAGWQPKHAKSAKP